MRGLSMIRTVETKVAHGALIMSKTSEKGRYSSPAGSATWEYIAAISCSSITFCLGCAAGWSTPTLPLLMAPDSPVPMLPSDAAKMMASMGIGMFLSPFMSIFVIEKLGRRAGLLCVSAALVIRSALIAGATDPIVLFVACLFSGVAFGLGLCLAPMYLGEIASPKLRGGLGLLITTSLNAGALFMIVVVPYVSIRTVAYVTLTIAAFSGMSIGFVPESPYHLAASGKNDEAEASLERLRGRPDVMEELQLVQATVRTQRSIGGDPERKMTYRQLSSVAGNRKAVYIQVLFNLLIQFGGYLSVGMYGQIIIEAMNSGLRVHVCMMVFAALQLTCSLLTTFIIDRVGRRSLIRVASIVGGFGFLVIGVYFYLMEHGGMDVTRYSIFPLAAIFMSMTAFSIGIVPIQLVLMSEIFATEVKGLANFVLGVVGGAFVTVSLVAYLTVTITWGLGHSTAFITFTAVTWTCSTLILMILPETKGKTLMEIQKDLNA